METAVKTGIRFLSSLRLFKHNWTEVNLLAESILVAFSYLKEEKKEKWNTLDASYLSGRVVYLSLCVFNDALSLE